MSIPFISTIPPTHRDIIMKKLYNIILIAIISIISTSAVHATVDNGITPYVPTTPSQLFFSASWHCELVELQKIFNAGYVASTNDKKSIARHVILYQNMCKEVIDVLNYNGIDMEEYIHAIKMEISDRCKSSNSGNCSGNNTIFPTDP